jgi:hydrogenase maturation factor
MCQAPVGKVLGVEDGSLTVDYNGKRKVLRSKLPEIKVGDYVLFSSGIAIDRVDKEEAESVLGRLE